MPLYNNGSQQYNLQQCQQIAQQNGATYFGLQNSTSGGNAQCTLSSDWAQTSEYGVAGNCTKIGDGSWSGGGWSNAVYNTTIPNSNYFLILQDDGNMVIYRGTSPTDNQGAIWASKTNSKQKEANPAYAAINGKYGQNWIASDSTLASGDFVGSTNGNLALIMQTDGNLVLYTFEMEPNCKKMTDGNTGGGVGANALYNIGSVGILSNLLKVGYVDQDSKIYEYPQNNIQYNNKYTKMEGVDSPGNDIPGATFDNATEESCTTACSNNTQCAGFSVSNNVCYPKTSSMYPTGNKTYDSNSNLFIRGKSPINNPVGVPSDINNIDSVLYQNYLNGGDIGTEYGLANATSIQKQQLSQIQTKMDQLSSQISTLTGKLGRGSNQVETQAQNNVKGIKTYLNNIKNANLKIVGFDTNVENILKDSDIVVLQKNYDYLFWSILAAGTVLIAMNVVKK
jgi:outer membrane murein-binding lipoprotein Lpp